MSRIEAADGGSSGPVANQATPRSEPKSRERVFRGHPACGGIAIGPVLLGAALLGLVGFLLNTFATVAETRLLAHRPDART